MPYQSLGSSWMRKVSKIAGCCDSKEDLPWDLVTGTAPVGMRSKPFGGHPASDSSGLRERNGD